MMNAKHIGLFIVLGAGMYASCLSKTDNSNTDGNDATAKQDVAQDVTSAMDAQHDRRIVVDDAAMQDIKGNDSLNTPDTATLDTTVKPDTKPADTIEQFRQDCVNHINELRATKGLMPLKRWKEAESCTDLEAEQDESTNHPHGAFGLCRERGQNTCPGWSLATAIDCLDAMWNEKDYAGCSGCDACSDKYTPSCPNCDFYGNTTGQACGHYVNMSAKYMSQVACGINKKGNWININFH